MTTGLLPLRAAACALGMVVALSIPTAAQTQSSSPSGLYVFGALGVNLPEDSDLDGSGFNLDADLDTGWTGSGGIGYAFGGGFRTEFEYSFRKNDVDSVSGTGATGDVRSHALMFNLLYDFSMLGPVRPYIGAGVGGARVKADGVSPVSGSTLKDRDIGLAWQATAGIAYAMNERTDLTLAYRYFSVPDLDYSTAALGNIESDYSTHEVMVGVRYRFGGPAPVPVPVPAVRPAAEPAPAPAPAPPPVPREYLVFFDWNSAQITPEAREILRTAVQNADRAGAARIRLTGHADRSGAAAYNQRLSVRRGEAVRAELQRLGVRESEMSVVGRGETEPLVPTDDGVREPRNRRVEIVLQ